MRYFNERSHIAFGGFRLALAVCASASSAEVPPIGREGLPPNFELLEPASAPARPRQNPDRSKHLLLPFPGVDVSAPTLSRRVVVSICFMDQKAHVPRTAVGRQAKVGECFLGGIVSNADFEHFASLFGCRDSPAQFFSHPDVALNHLNGGHAFALCCVPEVVLDAGPGMLSERDADR